MFYEFLQNGGKTEYQAAIELLKRISDDNKEDGKIIEKVKYNWDITSRNVTHNKGRLKLKRFLSAMANLGMCYTCVMGTWKSKNRHKYLLQYYIIFVCKYRKELIV